MPQTEQEKKAKRKEISKKYYQKNKEKIKEFMVKYRAENRQTILKKQEEYRNGPNREKELKRKREWAKNNPKRLLINSWINKGIKDEDLDGLYEFYINETNCWICGDEFVNDNGLKKRCLDHCHESGLCRFVCCSYCNLHVLREK